MKLNSGETKEMQKFAVRTPDNNISDITRKGFQTLGLTSVDQRLVSIVFPTLRQLQYETNARSPTLV